MLHRTITSRIDRGTERQREREGQRERDTERERQRERGTERGRQENESTKSIHVMLSITRRIGFRLLHPLIDYVRAVCAKKRV